MDQGDRAESVIKITSGDDQATLAAALEAVEFLVRHHRAEVTRLDTGNSVVFSVRLPAQSGREV